MSNEQMDELLQRMPQIAKAVNLFKSEEVQKAAFTAIMSLTLGNGLKSTAKISPPLAEESEAPPQSAATTPEKGQRNRKKGSDARAQWVFKKDLDLRPAGKQSFSDFVAEKQPKTNEDKYVVAVYYLSEIAERPTVSLDDIGSVFRLASDWREPKALDAGLRMASSRQGTLDTSDRANIFLTPHGRNYVKHDLPAPRVKK